MTDKPATLSLGADEYRALVADNLSRAVQFVQQNGQISAQSVKGFHDHMDRVKLLVLAWHHAAPLIPQPVAQTADVPADAVQANGEIKKRGGWPKGRARKPRQEAMQ